MKVAVLGATGMLGSMLVQYLRQHFEVVATVRNKDYEAPEGIEVRYYDAIKNDDGKLFKAIKKCDWIINAIGAIPQRVSDNFITVATNAFFPTRLQLVADVPGVKVIQIATDCVYSGRKGNYTESDLPNPIDIYGESKKQGEVTADHMYHIRCSIVGMHGSYSLLHWFLNQPPNATVQGFVNHLWNGVTTLHFAKVCQGIIEHDLRLEHMQHLVPADSVSKHELLRLFAKEFGREDIAIKPVEAPDSIDRTLSTDNQTLNLYLWRLAGYTTLPTIAEMVKELAKYK